MYYLCTAHSDNTCMTSVMTTVTSRSKKNQYCSYLAAAYHPRPIMRLRVLILHTVARGTHRNSKPQRIPGHRRA